MHILAWNIFGVNEKHKTGSTSHALDRMKAAEIQRMTLGYIQFI